MCIFRCVFWLLFCVHRVRLFSFSTTFFFVCVSSKLIFGQSFALLPFFFFFFACFWLSLRARLFPFVFRVFHLDVFTCYFQIVYWAFLFAHFFACFFAICLFACSSIIVFSPFLIGFFGVFFSSSFLAFFQICLCLYLLTILHFFVCQSNN